MYSNNVVYRIRGLIEAGNIIITMLLLLFLGVTIETWGISIETEFLWIAIFFALLVVSMFILEVEILEWEFLIILMPLVLGMILRVGLLIEILLIFCSCLFLTVFIVKQERQEINQAIDSVRDFTDALFGEIYGPVILIGTFVFAIAFYPFTNLVEIAYIIMLILIEILLCLLVANKEKIANINNVIIMPLFLFIMTILILVIYYLGFIEIVLIVIALSLLMYSIIKIKIVNIGND